MAEPPDSRTLTPADLLDMIVQLRAEVASLRTENAALKAQLEQRTRDAKRQAAPFSKGQRNAQPQRPGDKLRSSHHFTPLVAGLMAGFDEAAAKRELDHSELTLVVDLHQGKSSATLWTCDLTHDYITINASYRT